MPALSFRLKTILGVALIEGLLLLLLVLGNLDFLQRSFNDELHKRAEATLRLFIASSKDAVIASDLATLESAVQELLKTPGVVYARVYGHNSLLTEHGIAGTLARPFVADGRWQGEIWNRNKNGDIYAEWLSIVAIRNGQGEVQEYMSLFSDITKRKQDEERIWHQANFDALTGLPNRTLFHDRLSQVLQQAHREQGLFALMFIDLDRFKWVNDTLGHCAGDALLVEVARRLQGVVRESDTVARLAGDEFTVILPLIRHAGDVQQVAEKVLAVLSQPFVLEGQEVTISGSMGIALYPDDGGDVESLMRNADEAMYRSKEAGRNAFSFFNAA